MPKAKKICNLRITKCPRSNVNRRRENGRPRETYKKFPFEETKLGFFLKYEVPVVYDMVMSMTPPGPFRTPPYLLVKKMCESSPDPSFQKPKFRRYLQEYLEKGVYCHEGVKITPKKEAYYKGIRERKMRTFIDQNHELIRLQREIPGSADPIDCKRLLSPIYNDPTEE